MNLLNHLVVQSVQVIQAVGDAGEVTMTQLLVGGSGQVPVGRIDVR